MRIVVTGGCGFIGSHVVGRLLSDGHDVVVIDNHLARLWPDADYIRTDILDGSGLAEAMEGAGVVFHLAAVADVEMVAAEPLRASEVNIAGTAAALEAARRSGVGRFILASTVWVYGAAPGTGPVLEDSPLSPEAVGHVYTATKISSELLVQSYGSLYGLPFTILRYGIPYGPGMRDELVIARFIRQALAGQALTISGDGSQERFYVYVEDLADAHARALRPEAAGCVIALEGREAVSIRQLAEQIRNQVGGTDVVFQPARVGDFVARPILSTRAREVLGWEPSTPFSEGLRRCIEHYRRSAGRHAPGPPA